MSKHGVQPWQKASLHCQRVYEKDHRKKESTHRFLIAFENNAVFHASQLQHNWTKEWCECLDYIRIIDISHKASPEQLERYAPLYHFYRKHEQRSRSDSTIKQTSQFPPGSGPREARLVCMALSQLEMALRGKPNLRYKFHTMASSKISRSACLGKPRSIHQWWSVESKLVDNVLVGEIKMAMERRSLMIFFVSGFRTHVAAATVCATGGVLTLRVARTFFWHTFPFVANRHRVHAWLKVFAVREAQVPEKSTEQF